MKYITFLTNKLFSQQPNILLGRWSIVYCETKINKKIDLSNEDHCGVCNTIYQYNNSYTNENKNENKNENIKHMIFYETM